MFHKDYIAFGSMDVSIPVQCLVAAAVSPQGRFDRVLDGSAAVSLEIDFIVQTNYPHHNS
jgi:hypothetical protein